ncbi:DNA polymerase delta subunit 4 [Entomortierella parvispora]|uniref:DNA polymerase delta subunit 4 n=1 Tax=Entomortierella parvispora TaxID=205924 RepID=A0A9P3H9I0_9FUNG|nr:DNA polymerase delta subunit 4 [Entomortierella parvispora]
MAPPKKTAPAETSVASNFFQRGKKASLAQRPTTGKATLIKPSAKRTKVVQEELSDEIDTQDSDEEEHEQEQEEEEEEEEELVEEDDLTIVHDDEIQSDDDDNDSDHADFKKKSASVKVPAVAKAAAAATVSKAGTRSSSRKKVQAYIAPDVGDIHVGFHQADLSPEEKMLRQFDLASKYGPCTDMTRLERWDRAFALGLEPPQDVKDMIMGHLNLNTPLFQGRV